MNLEMPASQTKNGKSDYENDVRNQMTWTWIEKYWQTFSRSAVNGVMASFLMTYIRSNCREKAINHGGNVRMGTVAAALSSRADAERMPNRRNGEGVICVLGRTYVCVDDQAARFCQKK